MAIALESSDFVSTIILRADVRGKCRGAFKLFTPGGNSVNGM